MERRERSTSEGCHRTDRVTVSRRAALGSSGLAILGLLAGSARGGDKEQQPQLSERDAAIKARLEQRKAFGERMRTTGSAEERLKMMEEMRAMDRQRVIDGFKLQLGLSDQEWTVVKPRIEAVYNLVRPQPRGGPNQKKTEVDQRQTELRELLQSNAADSGQIKAKLVALRTAREKASQALAKARQDLRQLMNLRQEAVLVLSELLD